MFRHISMVAVAVMGVTVPFSSALAQDVVVMRRVLAKPTLENLPVRWQEGDWTNVGGPACTTSTPQRRTVTCLRDGRPADDAQCSAAGAKPVTERSVERTDACTWRWDDSQPFGAWTGNATCSDTAQRTRVVACLRSDRTVERDEAKCTGTRPVATEVGVHTGCTYRWNDSGWGAYAEACSHSTYRTRSITCQRDGDGRTQGVADSACTGLLGPKESERQENLPNYSGCEFRWIVTDGACVNEQRAQTATCHRRGGSTTEVVVASGCDDAKKPAATRPDATCVPTNVLLNGDFSNGVANWNDAGNNTPKWASRITTSENGNGYVRLVKLQADAYSDRLMQSFAVKRNTTYDISFRSRASVRYYVTLAVNGSTRYNSSNGTSAQWVDRQFTYTTSGNDTTASIRFDGDVGPDGTYVDIDDVKVVERK